MSFGLVHVAAVAGLTVALATPARAQTPTTPPPAPAPPSAVAAREARGTFAVQLKPVATDAGGDGTPMGRMSLDKQFAGDLVGTGKGEMLTGMTPVKGSAAYVAIERVTGVLHGRRGSFLLQHRGVMTRGAPNLAVEVVPDSGTGELAGLAGTMTIDTTGGGHAYVLAYTLPAAP